MQAYSATEWRMKLIHTSVVEDCCDDFLSKAQLPVITRCRDMVDGSDEKREESRVRTRLGISAITRERVDGIG